MILCFSKILTVEWHSGVFIVLAIFAYMPVRIFISGIIKRFKIINR